jgi:hypothetical protein
LARHRKGLDAVAKALLDQETIDGATVERLVDEAFGRPVHASGRKAATQSFNGHESGNAKSEAATKPEETPSPAAVGAAQAQSQQAPAQAPEPAQAPAATSTPAPVVEPAPGPAWPTNGTPSGWPAPQWPPPHWSPPPPADPATNDR